MAELCNPGPADALITFAGVVMNGLKCKLSKSQEKCDPSSELQMVPLHDAALVWRRCISSLMSIVATLSGKIFRLLTSRGLQTLFCYLPQNLHIISF